MAISYLEKRNISHFLISDKFLANNRIFVFAHESCDFINKQGFAINKFGDADISFVIATLVVT